MVYKFISSDQVISKVLADLDIKEDSVRVSDLVEWAGEAIEKIGSVRQFNRKISGIDKTPFLTIVGHQAAFPNDLHKLNQVMYSATGAGGWLPMTIATGSFSVFNNNVNNAYATAVQGSVQSVSNIDMVKLVMSIYNIEYPAAIEFISDPANASSLDSINFLIAKSPLSNVNNNTFTLKYAIKPGFIMTSMPTGFLKISYDAIYTDQNGYPMIPDMISYVEAIYWYILMKLKYPEYLGGRLNREVYYDIRRSWNFYCKQAYGEAMMPNEDEMETIKNNWNRLIPDMNANFNSYDTLGDPQNIRNLNRR
jgi:hypothetical protein